MRSEYFLVSERLGLQNCHRAGILSTNAVIRAMLSSACLAVVLYDWTLQCNLRGKRLRVRRSQPKLHPSAGIFGCSVARGYLRGGICGTDGVFAGICGTDGITPIKNRR
jgi:hypothetical protein